jgi:hypothetical protein
MPTQFKISSPLNQVTEIKQAIRESRKADMLAQQAAIRTFQVFRALKFDNPSGPPSAISALDRAHDQIGEARFALKDATDHLEKLLRQAGYTLPAKDT